jgi:lipopolysaccharide exporter
VTESIAARAGSAMAWKAAQLVGIRIIFLARTFILARLLVPEDFGLLAVSLVAVDFLASVTNLGMIPALVQREDVDERHYQVAWTIGIFRALLIAAAVFVLAPYLGALFAEPRAVALMRVIAIRPLIEAAASIKIAAVTRDLRFRQLALMSLPDAIVNTLVSILLAPALGVWALILGFLAGQAAYVLMSYWLAPFRPRFSLDVAWARPLIQFGQWIFVISLISLIGRSVLQLIIIRKLGPTDLGLYFLAAKLAFIPTDVASEVVGSVAFPLYARLQAEVQRIASVFRTLTIGLLALLLPASATMIVLAPALAAHVLGDQWQAAVPVIQLLALVNVVGLLGETASPILQGMGQPKKLAFIEVVQSSLLVAAVWLLADRFGASSAGLAWLAAVGATQAISVFYLRRMLPAPFAGMLIPISLIGLAGLGGATAAWSAVRLLPGLGGLTLGAILSVSLTGVLLWGFDRHFSFGLMRDLHRVFPQLSLLLRQTPVDG